MLLHQWGDDYFFKLITRLECLGFELWNRPGVACIRSRQMRVRHCHRVLFATCIFALKLKTRVLQPFSWREPVKLGLEYTAYRMSADLVVPEGEI